MSNVRKSFLSSCSPKAIFGNSTFKCRLLITSRKSHPYSGASVIPLNHCKRGIEPVKHSFHFCTNGFRFFTVWVRLVKNLSDDRYDITVSFSIFDIPGWRLSRESAAKSLYMSGSVLCILNSAGFKRDSRFERDCINNLSSGAQTISNFFL